MLWAIYSRSLFEKTLICSDERTGQREKIITAASSKEALEIISENAVKYAKVLTPTTMRFLWIDDAVPMCHCNQCKNFSDSDQALIIENAMIKALKKEYPNATLAHLAYVNMLTPPTVIKPEPGIFLEFAPIYRRWDRSLNDKSAGKIAPKQGNGGFFSHGQTIEQLYANLAVFPVETAQCWNIGGCVIAKRMEKTGKKNRLAPGCLQGGCSRLSKSRHSSYYKLCRIH